MDLEKLPHHNLIFDGVLYKVQDQERHHGSLQQPVRAVQREGEAIRVADAGQFDVIPYQFQFLSKSDCLTGGEGVAQMLA